MDYFIWIACIAIGLIAAAVIGWFIGRSGSGQANKYKEEAERVGLEAKRLLLENVSLKAEVQMLKSLSQEKEDMARKVETYHAQVVAEMQTRFDETIAKLQSQLQATTSQMLRERQREFGEVSSAQIKAIVAPLNDTIAEMKKTMASNTDQQSVFAGIFSANMENLLKQNEAARQSADRLANALRGNTKIQGEWGETVLTELLESQGLKEGIHFDTQVVLNSQAGVSNPSDLRPDVVLHLDNRRDVIIDSKASLSAYLNYMEATTPEEKQAALKAHIVSLENHVKELVRKNYSSLVKAPRSSIGYVIMFVPNTTALLLATSSKPGLWRWAMEQNVYIADEQTLYAALKIVHLTWTQIAQTENHRQVYALADEMLDRVGKFMDKYTQLGKSIQTLSKTYDEGLKKIQEDGHSVPQTCRKLIRMGAKMERRKGVDDALLGLAPDESESAE